MIVVGAQEQCNVPCAVWPQVIGKMFKNFHNITANSKIMLLVYLLCISMNENLPTLLYFLLPLYTIMQVIYMCIAPSLHMFMFLYTLLLMSAVVGNIFEKWLQNFVSFGNPCIICTHYVYHGTKISTHLSKWGCWWRAVILDSLLTNAVTTNTNPFSLLFSEWVSTGRGRGKGEWQERWGEGRRGRQWEKVMKPLWSHFSGFSRNMKRWLWIKQSLLNNMSSYYNTSVASKK